MGITVVHEAGHAMVAVLAGRRLQSIRLHSDTSGLTVTEGKSRGLGMVVMLAAGYLAPAALGLLAALMLADGRSVGLLWLLLLVLAGLLLWVRNGYGLAGRRGRRGGSARADVVRRRHGAVGGGVPAHLAAPARRAAAAAGAARLGPSPQAHLGCRPAGRSYPPARGRLDAGPHRRQSAGLVVGVSTLAPEAWCDPPGPDLRKPAGGLWRGRIGLALDRDAGLGVRKSERVRTVPSGKVKWFDADKGFGFLSQEEGPDVYVRSEALPEGVTTLKAGTRVEFGIAPGPSRRPGSPGPRPRRARRRSSATSPTPAARSPRRWSRSSRT